MFMSAGHIKETYDISRSTLCKWAEDGKVVTRRFPGGKRLYRTQDIRRLLGEPEDEHKEKIIYARVSSSHQEGDLERQIQDLLKAYPNHRVISDIGSGINFKRRGLQALLDLVYQGTIGEVVVAFRDRLARFGIDLIHDIFKRHQVQLVVHNGDSGGDSQELSQDLLAVVDFFVARNNGRRSGANKRRRREETQTSAERLSEEDHQQMVRGLQMDLQPVPGGLSVRSDSGPLERRLSGSLPQQQVPRA